MDKLIQTLNKLPNGSEITIIWTDIAKILAEIDTIYETDNGLEPTDIKYREFYSCLVLVKEILFCSTDSQIREGDYIDITEQNSPSKIIYRGKQIW